MKFFISAAAIMCLFAFTVISETGNKQLAFEHISLKASDGVSVSANLYSLGDDTAPWVILCHQAGYSRGEYLEIAPKLNELGYNCVALDQRSGKEVNDVQNQTHVSAEAMGLPTTYPDAIPDVKAALDYVTNEKKGATVILWGSSYSASLTFVMAAKHPELINAIVAFSPSEYFTVDGKEINEFATEVTCPVFISSAKSEHDAWKGIYEKVSSVKSYHLPEVKGIHGSRGLWESTEGNEEAWGALKEYLKSL